MYIILVGCDGTGKALAERLIGEGHEVAIVELDENRAKALSESMDALIINGDGTNTDILKDAGIEQAGAAAALTSDDNTNLAICQRIKKFENVKRIVARVNDPNKKDLYLSLNITAAISPISAVVSYFKNALIQSESRSITSVANGKAEVIEVPLTNESLVGRKIKDSGLPSDSNIVAINRAGEVLIPNSDTILEKNDIVTLVAKTDVIKDALTILKG